MKKNSLNRVVLECFTPYGEPHPNSCQKLQKTPSIVQNKMVESISNIFEVLKIQDGMTLSFHHHLRDGDYVLNLVLEEIKKRGLKDLTLAPSSIFPIHQPMVELIKNGQIKNIYTNYINGPVAKAVSEGHLKGMLVMDTHGGRPRAIESGELKIDVAFIATPAANTFGDGNGIQGQSQCGALGYAISDLYYAKHKVVITDYLTEDLLVKEIDGSYVDYVVKVDKIGNPDGIVSGTTKPTKDPVQLKIAKDTIKVMDALGLIKNGMSFQTGAGGTSIAVADLLRKKMIENNIKGSFASGGITSYLVKMHEEGLFEELYDVQCFDLEGIRSYRENLKHHPMSASEYANPCYMDAVVNKLGVVILGATEIDLDFNVNVTTDSSGYLMGGSGGHSDTAYGAKVSIITSNLIKSRTPIIKQSVTALTTPGSTVDIFVTERGITVNPRRKDLLEILRKASFPVVSIETLYQKAIEITGLPKPIEKDDKIIGQIRYRDGSIIDTLYQVRKS